MQKPKMTLPQRQATLMQLLKELPRERRQKVIAQVKAAAGRPKGPIKPKA